MTVTEGDDQEVVTGGSATFTITVTNTGYEELRDVEIEDELAPACSRTASETQSLIQAVGNNDTIFDRNESFSYQCIVENVT